MSWSCPVWLCQSLAALSISFSVIVDRPGHSSLDFSWTDDPNTDLSHRFSGSSVWPQIHSRSLSCLDSISIVDVLVQLDIGIFCGPLHTAYLTLVQAAGVAFIGVTDCFLSYRSTHSKKARTLLIIGRKNIYARFSITTVDAEPSTQLDRYSASLLNIKIHSLAFH